MNRFYDYRHPVYNSFDIRYLSAHNKRELKALLSVQRNIVDEVLTEKQREVVEYVFFDNYSQKDVAEMLGVNPSTVCRHLKRSFEKIRPCLELCDDAIRYYKREGD